MPSTDPDRGLRVVICDDDPVARGVIGDLVEELGGEVLAETDSAIETTALLDRFEADVLVLDLFLRHGTGGDVLAALARRPDGPRIVVFTAYDSIAPVPGERVDVVHKPDFDGLARCLASLRERTAERRRHPVRTVPGPGRPGIDDAAGFYRVLNDAEPGDVLVSVRTSGLDPTELVGALRRTVRVQDRVHPRSGDVLLLLIGGGEAAVRALEARLRPTVADIAERTRAVDVGDDPTGAFSQLTS